MKIFNFEKFQQLPELNDDNDVNHLVSNKNIEYYLQGDSLIGQKDNKKIGDVVTIYKVIRTDKNKVMYIPEYFKLV